MEDEPVSTVDDIIVTGNPETGEYSFSLATALNPIARFSVELSMEPPTFIREDHTSTGEELPPALAAQVM